MHLPRSTKWTLNMDAQIKAECFSNQKVIYDYTTGCLLKMQDVANNQTRNFTAQPHYTSPISRRQFLWDIVMGGVQALRNAIIYERIDMAQNHNDNHNPTPSKDLPFTMESNNWEESVFVKYRKRHPTGAPKTPVTPITTNRGSLRNRNGISRTIRNT